MTVEETFREGFALQSRGDLAPALACYERVIAAHPGHFDALHLAAVLCSQIGQKGRGLELFDQALAIVPDSAACHGNKGVALQELGRRTEALESFERALALAPTHADAHYNRGNTLHFMRQFEQAIASHDRAVALQPGYTSAWANRGVSLQALGRCDEALASYARAIAIDADHLDAHWNRALCQLLSGDLVNGWRNYEWRWKVEKVGFLHRRNFAQPLWLGQTPLSGKTLLVHAEQGLGDTLQFCRHLRQVVRLGARVVFEVPRALWGVLAPLSSFVHPVLRGCELPAFDLHCPLLSLPHALGIDLSSIPLPDSAIKADPGRVQFWRDRLGKPVRPRIGLAWGGSQAGEVDDTRSVALAELVQHLPRGFDYVSLQKEITPADRDAFNAHGGIRHPGADFVDAAALCEVLDLVVSVDTSIAHLAGTLGRPVWVLLPRVPDWRWMLDRPDSPWYPTARLWRQARQDDWAEVLERVAAALRLQFSV